MLAIQCDLISEYMAFQKGRVGKYDNETIAQLFKYLHPFKMSVKQKNHIGMSDEEAQALAVGDFIKIRNFKDENDLIQSTSLKIMLSKDSTNGTFPYPYINILDDEIDVNFTTTYKKNESRVKAIEHIKQLLLDSTDIKIFDKYLFYKKNWKINRDIIANIFPKNSNIKIYADKKEKINDVKIIIDKELFFKRICFTNLKTCNPKVNLHDRYIETNKYQILLSSGLYYLSNEKKDFTYIVKVK
jgi:hypothetical protein